MKSILLVFLTSSCVRSGAFECAADGECGPAGQCEASGFCAFPDPGCDSGWRYGRYAADDLADRCVDDGGGPGRDGGPLGRGDGAVPDGGGPACGDWGFAVTNVDPCAAGIPPAAGPLVVSGGEWRLETAEGVLRDPTGAAIAVATAIVAQPGGPSLRVLVVDALTVAEDGRLTVRGEHALVILAHDDITVSGTIDAGGGEPQAGEQAGPGAEHPGACAGATGAAGADNVTGGSGGGGGGFGEGGGSGGVGGLPPASGGVGGLPSGGGTLSPLRGGCGGGTGGAGGNDDPGGAGGKAGGALQLVARSRILIDGGSLTAPGGPGHGGDGGGNGGGGGGGGSGGALFLESEEVRLGGARLCANGGAGGEGGQSVDPGAGGERGTCSETVPARSPDTTEAGDGGDGGVRLAAAGPGGAGDVYAGGGGGGGAVGRIRLHGLSGVIDDGTSVLTPAPE